MSRKLLRFFEFDKVDFRKPYVLVGGENFLFDDKYQNALNRFHSQSQGIYYSLIYHGIRLCEQVGAIQVLDLTIEVLPKMDKDETNEEKWHQILIDMLRACKLLAPRSNQDANLKLKSNSILELYFQKYVLELESLMHSGLIKRYRRTDGNVRAFKGSLLFQKNIQQNLVHGERFYTRHSVYDRNHLLHSVLRQALEVIDLINRSISLCERIKSLLLDWPETSVIDINSQTIDKIHLNRKTSCYKEALSIAKLILMNYHPDIKGGRNQVMALMFNMNNLWEEFIYQRLKYAAHIMDWEVFGQKGLVYWSNNFCRKKLVPDMIICDKLTKRRIVIDTKWKRPQRNKPDDSDLRQILAYKLYYHSDYAFLLYPNNTWEAASGEYFNQGYNSNELIFREGVLRNGGMLFTSILTPDNKLQNRLPFSNGTLIQFLDNILKCRS